jgi:putative membrane protein
MDAQGPGPGLLTRPWFLIMVGGALALLAWHYYLGVARRALAAGRRVRSERFWRALNELPFLIAIVIVLAATTKLGA